jgi:hypothetical protein
MFRIGLRVRSLALIGALACGAAQAAALDAATPDFLVPDPAGAAIETHLDADGSQQIDIQGERFDGRRLIKRLLTDLRDGPSTPPGADFDLHIAVATLAGFNGEELRGVDLRLARRAGRIDDFALTGNTPGGAAVRGSAGSNPNARRSLFIEADDAGAFLRFVDLYGKLATGRMWLTIDLPAMQDIRFGIRDFELPDEPVLRRLREALTPSPGQTSAQLAGAAPSRLRGQLGLSPGKIVVKNTTFFNKHATVTLEGIIADGELNMRGLLAPANFAFPQEPPCNPSQCLLGVQYTLTGPIGAPQLRINPFLQSILRSVLPPP